MLIDYILFSRTNFSVTVGIQVAILSSVPTILSLLMNYNRPFEMKRNTKKLMIIYR